jgi:hypothetical protein
MMKKLVCVAVLLLAVPALAGQISSLDLKEWYEPESTTIEVPNPVSAELFASDGSSCGKAQGTSLRFECNIRGNGTLVLDEDGSSERNAALDAQP